jgi:hypothetical protein
LTWIKLKAASALDPAPHRAYTRNNPESLKRYSGFLRYAQKTEKTD